MYTTKQRPCDGRHVDDVPGVRYPAELPPGQIVPTGLDLVEACPCEGSYSNDRAGRELIKHRFGLDAEPYMSYYGFQVPVPAHIMHQAEPIVGMPGYSSWNSLIGWRCSSGLVFVRRKKGQERPLTVEGMIKIPGKAPKPKMVKVPGRRKPGYLSGARP